MSRFPQGSSCLATLGWRLESLWDSGVLRTQPADACKEQGADALHAMGEAYETVMADRDRLMLMLKCWASCDDPEICEAVRGSWRDLVDLAERASGESPEAVSAFFSKGALLTVLMAMEAFTRPEPWSNRLIEGCQTGMTA